MTPRYMLVGGPFDGLRLALDQPPMLLRLTVASGQTPIPGPLLPKAIVAYYDRRDYPDITLYRYVEQPD